MIRIDEIKINGYKNIKSADLKLGNFNVIIGANNSGKSNFIQVFSFLNYIINSSIDEVERSFSNSFKNTFIGNIVPTNKFNNFFKNGNKAEKEMCEFEILFSNSITKRVFNYKLDLEWEKGLTPYPNLEIKNESLDVKEANKTGPPNLIFRRKYGKVKYGNQFSKMEILENVTNHSSVIRFLKILNVVEESYKDAINTLEEILKTPTYYFSHIELLKTESERTNTFNGRLVSFELEEEISKLQEGEKWNIFEDILKNILGIGEVSVMRFERNSLDSKFPLTILLTFIHNGTRKSLKDFSDGTLLIIAIITKILSNENSIIFIEEPENSTHPKALIDLISFLKSFSENTQFVITSHSLAILNKTRIEDIIVSTIEDDGLSVLYNVSGRKDLKERLKKSRVNFSDELFFNIDDKNEFE